MATTKRKRPSSTPKKKAAAPLISPQRKQEILGLILMALALLTALALGTYAPADDALAQEATWGTLLTPPAVPQNALGLVGAVLARALVANFLGYTSLLLCVLIFSWGYVVFRRRKTVYLPLLTALGLIGAVVLATFFGWLTTVAGADLGLWSGNVGLGVAGWMMRVFGTVGSMILLGLLFIVTVLLAIDHDIQRSLDRLEAFFGESGTRIAAWRASWRERSEERRTERARLREEKEQAGVRTDAPSKPGRPAKAEPSSRPTRRSGEPKAEPQTRLSPPRPVVTGRTLNDLFRDTAPSVETSPAIPPPAAPPPRLTPKPVAPPAEEPLSPQPIELKVRERIEEEKADDIARDADAPDLDLPYAFPPIDLLDVPDDTDGSIDYDELEENKQVLLDALATYNIEIVDINAVVGPTVTLYELAPAPGVKISRITALEDDLAMAMAARGIRMIAPIPGKSAIGVEIPNRHRELVQIRDIIGTAKFRDAEMELPIVLGKSIEGEVYLQDLTKMPHLLVAGATGSGKSVGINALITGLIYHCHPANLKFVMIDPKKIELQQYKELAGHFIAMPEDGEDPVITAFEDALGVLQSCEKEMERRYDLLSKASVRGIKEYNRKLADGKLDEAHRHLPYVVVIVDELADLMMTAGKEIEGPIARLAQMARAVGIHLVLATQRPSVDVITGLIKANFPSRVAYQVASKIDSRTILDQNGAEGLVGNGDLLFMSGSRILRLQGPFVSIDEVDRLMAFISEQPGPGPYLLPSAEKPGPDDAIADALGLEETDDLFEEAARIIVMSQQGSVSLLQRKLSVGYTRAARIVDQLEEAGIVGPFLGSKARDVLVSDLQQLEAMLGTDDGDGEDA